MLSQENDHDTQILRSDGKLSFINNENNAPKVNQPVSFRIFVLVITARLLSREIETFTFTLPKVFVGVSSGIYRYIIVCQEHINLFLCNCFQL